MSTPLVSTGAVIDAIGGTTAAGRLLGYSPQAVTNWRASQTFPAKTFLAFQGVLRERGLSAPPELWGQKVRPNEQAVA